MTLDRFAPMQLIEVAADGEVWAVRAWHEFEVTTNGRRAIEWSRGLRDLVELDTEQTDEELTVDQVEGEDGVEVVATLTAATWVEVCRAGMDYDVVRAAADGGLAGVLAVVAQAKRVPRQWWRRCADRALPG